MRNIQVKNIGGIYMNENKIGSLVVDSAVYLHQNLGPGLVESIYEGVLMKLFAREGLSVERQVPIPMELGREPSDGRFLADLIIDGKVIIDLKSVAEITEAHKKQLLKCLEQTETKLGYILNFGSPLMENGIVRVANGLSE